MNIFVPAEDFPQAFLNYSEEAVRIGLNSKDISCHISLHNQLNIKFSSLKANSIEVSRSLIIRGIFDSEIHLKFLLRVKVTFFYFFNKLTFQVYRRMNLSKTEISKHTHSHTSTSLSSLKFSFSSPNIFSVKSVSSCGRSSGEVENRWEKSDHQYFCQKKGEKGKQPSPLTLIRMPKILPSISLSDLNKIEFSPLPYSIKKLAGFSQLILEGSHERKALGKTFNLPRLIQLLAGQYKSIAYHNFTHSFSVLQLLFQAYNRCQVLRKCISQKYWFFTFVAALAHDLNHPGTNNAFEVKSRSYLAIEAGNQCVLQKMHLGVLWGLLKKHSQVNFLQGFSSQESKTIKKFITRLILSTDIGNHFNGLSILKQLQLSPQPLEGQLALTIIEQVFHASDVGNPCLHFQDYINWASLISYQFNQIAAKQEHLGLEPSHYLRYSGKKEFYSSQISFCNSIVLPLWKEIAVILPGLREFKENIENNLTLLKEEMDKI